MIKFETKNDVAAYYAWHRRYIDLHIQAHDLCNTLCDKLYNWNPEPERAARLERILQRARARLARREQMQWEKRP